jgi:hypothetical protein
LRCAVASLDGFTEDNDPYRERDFGAIELEGERYFWKIVYYDRSLLRRTMNSTGSAPHAGAMTVR